MIRFCIYSPLFFKPTSWCNIHFTTKYWLYPLTYTSFIHFYSTKHITMICNCYSTHTKFFYLFY